MEKTLSKIRMGEYKLCFNVARFTLEDGEINNRQSEKFKPKPANDPIVQPIGRKEFKGMDYGGVKFFKDAVMGRSIEDKGGRLLLYKMILKRMTTCWGRP
ncbi:hypothetical protein Hanom_Chr06g00517531 [Helianthus anomalus]